MPDKIVALLPMKGNSERVKGKNFREFAGKPLFRWMLDTLVAVPEIDSVVINTDARSQLASMGLESGGKILIRDRPQEICGDFVSMNRVIENDIANVPAAAYVMTHTTNPLISGTTIRRALSEFLAAKAAGRADSLFTVNRFQSRFYDSSGRALNHDPANLIRTQDLEPWFEENSQLYLFTRESFEKTNARIGGAPMMFLTPRSESADIDDQEDWDIAERLARTLPS